MSVSAHDQEAGSGFQGLPLQSLGDWAVRGTDGHKRGLASAMAPACRKPLARILFLKGLLFDDGDDGYG